MLKKWKSALINRLKDLKNMMGSIDGRAGIFPRRYFLLVGAYLATIVLLILSLFILRWGSVPSPELPGVERGMEYSFEEEDIGEKEDYSGEEFGEITSGLQVSKNTVIPEAEEVIEEPGVVEPDYGQQESMETVQPADAVLMQAASPLPQWSLHHSYGSYVAETLPSGGKLHRLLNGVFFRGTPGASVTALWDGYVVTAGGKDGPYSLYVLLQHDGGFMTFYGNLREVWVEEGSFVSRGENLGLLPYLPQKGLPPGSEQEVEEEVSQQVPIRTIWRGIPGEVASSWTGAWQTDNDRAEPVSAVSTFYGESPLLYLEVRQGNSYMNPLKFIHTRN